MKKTKKIDTEEINKLKAEIQELKTGWQRTQADWENYRKRTEGQLQEVINLANIDLMTKIFPIMDGFRRAANHIPKELEQSEWVKGIQLIEKQLDQLLTEEGLEKIIPKPKEGFDPRLHEAVSCEEDKNCQENQIIELVEVGYRFGDKIIKPAKVRVAK